MQPITQTFGKMGDNLEGLEPDQNRGNHVPLPPPPPPPPYERGYPDAAEVARYLTEAMARVPRPAMRDEQIGCSFKDFCAHHYQTFDGSHCF
jgi:hypothetical protein